MVLVVVRWFEGNPIVAEVDASRKGAVGVSPAST
jgi:hypothetical protein